MSDVRIIAKARADGEPTLMHYDELVHPGIIKRLTMAGLDAEHIAAALGVANSTLYRWRTKHQAVADAFYWGRDVMATAHVIESLYDQAVGYLDKDGRRRGVNVAATIFWLKNQAGWRNEPPETKEDDANATQEELVKMAQKIIDREAQVDDGGGPIIDADFTEFADFK